MTLGDVERCVKVPIAFSLSVGSGLECGVLRYEQIVSSLFSSGSFSLCGSGTGGRSLWLFLLFVVGRELVVKFSSVFTFGAHQSACLNPSRQRTSMECFFHDAEDRTWRSESKLEFTKNINNFSWKSWQSLWKHLFHALPFSLEFLVKACVQVDVWSGVQATVTLSRGERASGHYFNVLFTGVHLFDVWTFRAEYTEIGFEVEWVSRETSHKE